MPVKTIDEVEGLDRLSRNAKTIILRAYDIARHEIRENKKEGQKVNPQHIFVALLMQKSSVAYKILQRMGIPTDQILVRLIKPRSVSPKDVEVSDDFNQIIVDAFWEANQLGHVYVGSEHLLLSLFQYDDITRITDYVGKNINFDVIKNAVVSMGNYHPGIFSSMPNENVDSKGALDYFTRDMNEMAREGKFLPIFGRNDEIERLIHILSRKNKNNPVLIGEAGVGKTAIVEGFVQRILSGDVPDALANYRVIQLDLAVILAGAKIRGDVEERLLAVLDELRKDENKVVFIDEIHMIIGAGTAGSGGGMDIANLLKPHLTSGDIKVIGATTFDEYQKYFEEDNALTRRFQPIQIDEISKEDAVGLLNYVKKEYENFHEVKIGEGAIVEAVKLSDRYITDRFLPDKALDVLDETAAKKKLSQKSILQSSVLTRKLEKARKDKNRLLKQGDLAAAADKREEEVNIQKRIDRERIKLTKKTKGESIDADDIRGVVSKMTGIPLTTMTESDVESLKNLEKSFSEQVIGQEAALDSVAAALKRARVGLMDQDRPLASFLFLGPTGVGKTETAKVIARFLFGDDQALVQVNMSEFMEPQSVSKIIGSPPGYVGYSEGGQLTEKVRRKPYSVVLFDEVEKAHPDTLNVLLQILDEGEIRDSKGRNVNFRNTIIIMTSNIGAEAIAKDDVLGFDMHENDGEDEQRDGAYDEMKDKLLVELKDEMRPEFLNRIDEIVIYRGLDKTDAQQISQLLLERLQKRLEQFNLKLSWNDDVVKYIADEGFSEEYGARNLRRTIQEVIETRLSELILEDKIDTEKGSKVKVSRDKKEKDLKFDIKK